LRTSDFEQGEIGPDLFRKACEFGLEGLVSKRSTVSRRQVEGLDQGQEPEPSGIEQGRGIVTVNDEIEMQLQTGPACLMFFTDETGHENFADPNYPVFGLGGCAIISSAAEANIRKPWRAMKAAHFGGADVPLHASALRDPTSEQLNALSKFFREQQFARYAVTMSKSVVLPTGMTPFELAARALANRFQDLLRRVSPEPNEVALLHEASDRCNQLIQKYLGGTVVRINDKLVPVHKGLVKKSRGLPELEVADFVMHAAGRRAVHLHRDPTAKAQKDFEAVFYSNPVLDSYMHINGT
jgi:Protein of unknown function (DUF3800)